VRARAADSVNRARRNRRSSGSTQRVESCGARFFIRNRYSTSNRWITTFPRGPRGEKNRRRREEGGTLKGPCGIFPLKGPEWYSLGGGIHKASAIPPRPAGPSARREPGGRRGRGPGLRPRNLAPGPILSRHPPRLVSSLRNGSRLCITPYITHRIIPSVIPARTRWRGI
jgi:hypothetical protein